MHHLNLFITTPSAIEPTATAYHDLITSLESNQTILSKQQTSLNNLLTRHDNHADAPPNTQTTIPSQATAALAALRTSRCVQNGAHAPHSPSRNTPHSVNNRVASPNSYFTGNRRPSVYVPMSTLETTIQDNIVKQRAMKHMQVNPAELLSHSAQNPLPENSQSALLTFYHAQKTKAFLLTTARRTKHNVLNAWSRHTYDSKIARENSAMAAAHYHITNVRRGLATWSAYVTDTKYDNHARRIADKYFGAKTNRKTFDKWIDHKISAQANCQAQQHFAGVTNRRTFNSWLTYRLTHRANGKTLQTTVGRFKRRVINAAMYLWKDYIARTHKYHAASLFFDNSTTARAFNQWTSYISYCRKRNAAIVLFHRRVVVKMFHYWQQYIVVARKYRAAATFFQHSSTSHYFNTWRDYHTNHVTHQRNLHAAMAHCCSSLLRCYFSKLCSYTSYRAAKHALIERAHHHRLDYQKRCAFSSFMYFLSPAHLRSQQLSQTAHVFLHATTLRRSFYCWSLFMESIRKSNHAVAHFFSRLLRSYFSKFVAYTIHSFNQHNLLHRALSHNNNHLLSLTFASLQTNVHLETQNRLLIHKAAVFFMGLSVSRSWKSWCCYIIIAREKRLLLANMDAFYLEQCARRAIAKLSRHRSTSSQHRSCMPLAVSFYATKQKTLTFVKLSRLVKTAKNVKRMQLLSFAFNQNNLSKYYFAGWKAHTRRVMENVNRAALLMDAIRHKNLAYCYDKWLAHLLLCRRARSLLSSWSQQTRTLLLIRKTAAWWKNGLLSRCVRAWVQHTDDSKRIKKAVLIWTRATVLKCFVGWKGFYQENKYQRTLVDDIATQYYNQRRVACGLVTWRAHTVHTRSIKDKLNNALQWITGNLLVKMMFSWKEFVRNNNDLKRAVSLFTKSCERKIMFRWQCYVEERKRKGEMMTFAEEARTSILLKRGLHRFAKLIAPERKAAKSLLLSAIHLFGGNVVFKCFRTWTDHVEEIKKMRSALSIFSNSLVMRCMRKWAMYRSWRAEKKAMETRSDQYYETRQLSKAVEKLSSLCSEERKEWKRSAARSLSWFVDGAKTRCFNNWKEYVLDAKRLRWGVRIFKNALVMRCVRRWCEMVDEQKRMRSALAIFTNALVMRCLRKWVVWLEGRLEKKEAERHGVEFWKRKAKGRVLEKLGGRVKTGQRWKKQVQGALAWLMNGLLKKCLLNWGLWVRDQKKMRFALGMFNEGVVIKCLFGWKRFVEGRREGKELKRRGELFWQERAMRTSVRSWVGGVEERVKTEALLKKAKYWFGGILLYRVWNNWVMWIRDQKQTRRAVAMFRDIVVYKCWGRWGRYVAGRREKRELMEKVDRWREGREVERGLEKWWRWGAKRRAEGERIEAAEAMWRERSARKALSWMREDSVGKKKLRAIVGWMEGVCMKRCLEGWKRYVEGRREKVAREELASAWHEERGGRAVVRKWRRWGERRKVGAVFMGIGAEVWEGGVKRRVFGVLKENRAKIMVARVLGEGMGDKVESGRYFRRWERVVFDKRREREGEKKGGQQREFVLRRKCFTAWGLVVDSSWRKRVVWVRAREGARSLGGGGTRGETGRE